MMNRTAITTIDDLQTWWASDDERPYWTLYRGVRGGKSADIIHRNETLDSQEASWDLLEQLIAINSTEGGEFTILRSDKPKSNYGHKAVVILKASHSVPAVSGFNSAVAGFPMIGSSPGAIQTYIAEQVEKEREKWELGKRVEDLEAAINEKQQGTFLERAFSRITEHEHFDKILNVALARILGGKSQAQPAHVGISGAPGSQAADDGFRYDEERIALAMERIRVHIPDIHGLMDTLANFVERDPDMARSLIKQIQ